MAQDLRIANCIKALMLLLAITACDQVDPTAEDYIERARVQVAAGEFGAGVIEFKNAIQKDHANAEARSLLGRLYARLGDGARAEKELIRARDFGRFEFDERIALVGARLMQGNFVGALAEIPQDPDDDHALAYHVARGQAQLGLRRLDDAEAAFQDALARQPGAAVYAGLARVAYLRPDLALAGTHLDVGMAEFPLNRELIALSGERFIALGEVAEAEAEFNRGVELDTSTPDLRNTLGYARVLLMQQKFDDARPPVQQLLELAPQSIEVNLLDALIALSDREYKRAQDIALQALNTDEGNVMALGIGGMSSYFLEQYERANGLLARYVDRVPQDRDARRILGATKLRLGSPGAAVEALQGLPEDIEQDAGYHTLAGLAAAMNGELARGVEELEQAVEQSPENAASLLRLGVLKAAAGLPIDGAADIERAIELNPELELDPNVDRAIQLIIAQQIRQGNFAEALELATAQQEKDPTRSIWYVLTASAHTGLDQIPEAIAGFEKALEITPGRIDASMNLAQLYAIAGEIDRSLDLLKVVLTNSPANERVLLQFASIALRAGKAEDAKIWLERGVDAQPDAVRPRIALARAYTQLGRPADAIAAAAPGLRTDPDNRDLLLTIGVAQIAAGETDDAVTTLAKLVEVAPDLPQARLLLARAHRDSGDIDMSMSVLQTAIDLDPANVEASVMLAQLALRANNLEVAAPVIEQLAEAHPDIAQIRELQGHLALQSGNPAGAIEHFQSVREVVDSRQIAEAIAAAQWQADKQSLAIATLEEWVDRNENDMRTRLQLAQYHLGLDHRREAVSHFRLILEAQPDNWIIMNDLAWLLYEGEELAEASELAQRALELAPEVASVIDTAGVILFAQGDIDAAATLLQKAFELLPENGDIGFHFARAQARRGDREQARETLRQVLEVAAEFDERDAADTLLRELGG